MSKIAIHQFSPSLSYGDAISNYAIDLMKLLRSWGYSSDIYVDSSDPRVSKYCKKYTTYQPNKNDILVYHYGSASEITPFLLNWPKRLVLIYHNITPHHFYELEDSQISKMLKQAREDLKLLRVIPYAVGDSEFNCQELRALGFNEVQRLPYLLNLNALNEFSNTNIECDIINRLADGYTNILFVGRIVPNKRHDDLIRFLAYYQRFINPKTRLLLVGSASYRYKTILEFLSKDLGVDQDVHFLGHVELKDGFTAYYKAASIFLSMSEHEGFGVPWLESMYFDLPVIAYASTAVPETMGEAGILVTQKRYEVIAELVNLVVTNDSLRTKIIYKQRQRLQDFDRMHLEKQFRDWVSYLEQKFDQ